MKPILPLLLMSALLGATPATAQVTPQFDDTAMRDVLSRAAESLSGRQGATEAQPGSNQPATETQSSYGQSSYDQTSYSQPAPAAPGMQQNSVAAASQFNPAAAAAQSAAVASDPAPQSRGEALGGRPLRGNAGEAERPAVPLRGTLPPLRDTVAKAPATRIVASAAPVRREANIRLRTPRIPFPQAETSNLAPEAAIAAARIRIPAPPFEELN